MCGSGSRRLSESNLRPKVVRLSGENGAEGIRTPGLLPARQALSQLSYGPVGGKSSRELEVLCPVDPPALVVPRGSDSQGDRRRVFYSLDRNEVAAVEIDRVGGDGVNLPRRIPASYEAVRSTSARHARNDQHLAPSCRPFALDPEQSIIEAEDEVVAASVGNRAIDLDAELDGFEGDGRLRDGSLLIRCHE
jgi:hypothetical protein